MLPSEANVVTYWTLTLGLKLIAVCRQFARRGLVARYINVTQKLSNGYFPVVRFIHLHAK